MRILHLEDDPNDAELIRLILTAEFPGCVVDCVDGEVSYGAALDRGGHDLVLSDFAVPGLDGFEALRRARRRRPEMPFIFVSGTIGEDRAIEAVRLGAEDYVLKDRLKRLGTVITRALREAGERRQRRSAEDRIRELADCLDQASEAVIVTDLDDRITYWNTGAERMLGWSAAAVMGHPLAEVMPAESLATARQDTARTGRWCGEVALRNGRGESLVVESRHTLVAGEHGQPRGYLCISNDVTERKQLEEQFLRAQRMENLGLLAAGIAHDLNNTLAPILLATPMLQDHVSDSSARRLLDTLGKSAERGSLLVRQILSFAHGVGGELQLLQVKHLLRDIAAVISGTFPKSIRLDDYVPTELWPVQGNATQIHQVLLNLCVNARDAMPAGGTLQLRGENVEFTDGTAASIQGARPGCFLVLHVADSGTGIPPEILPRIWEPFFTTKSAGRGTGLGLSTVRSIVEAHHGFVEIRSRLGEGTIFRVYLPAAGVAAPDGAPCLAPAIPRGQGELILIADDEEQVREMTSVALRRFGYRVILASDGVEAAALFADRAAEIRLVVSDLHMPNLDGAMLTRALRRINPEIKVLVMSGMVSGLGEKQYVPEEFAQAVLLKPFKPEALLEQIHQLLHAPAT